jgi:gp16 family phage-associated protein
MKTPHKTMQLKQEDIDRVKAEMAEIGLTQAEWARQNNVSREVVADVLSGRRKCLWGESHKVAVALGLKQGQVSHKPFRPIHNNVRRAA